MRWMNASCAQSSAVEGTLSSEYYQVNTAEWTLSSKHCQVNSVDWTLLLGEQHCWLDNNLLIVNNGVARNLWLGVSGSCKWFIRSALSKRIAAAVPNCHPMQRIFALSQATIGSLSESMKDTLNERHYSLDSINLIVYQVIRPLGIHCIQIGTPGGHNGV